MAERRLKDLSDDELLTLIADLEAAHERAEAELMARRPAVPVTGDQVMQAAWNG